MQIFTKNKQIKKRLGDADRTLSGNSVHITDFAGLPEDCKSGLETIDLIENLCREAYPDCVR
jgi:hypothetical protein